MPWEAWLKSRAWMRKRPAHPMAAPSPRAHVEQLALAASEAMASGCEDAALGSLDELLAYPVNLDEWWIQERHTLLTFACWKRSARVVAQLLDHGANPNAPRRDGALPLHLAAAAGRADITHALLQWAADPSACNPAGFTALQQALLLAPCGTVAECRELLLLAGHRETADDRVDWARRRCADLQEPSWQARFRCEGHPPPEAGAGSGC